MRIRRRHVRVLFREEWGTEAFLECFEKHLEEVKKTHQFEEIAPVAAEGMSSCED